MLDNHRTYNHAGRLCACASSLVVEFLTIQLLEVFPWEMIAQPHPTVPLVQPVKRRTEGIDGQLLVTWLEFHLLVSFNTQRYDFFVKRKKKLCYKYLIFNKLILNQ